jgi:HK97 family phage prohead protease
MATLTTLPTLRGRPVVFNSESVDLGGFVEIIAPQAVDRTLREQIDVRALVDHDPGRVLGRRSAGTLRLAADSRGLTAEIDLPDTGDGRDLAVLTARGDVTGYSFAFRAIEDAWTDRAGRLVRTVLDMRFYEISVVAFNAYPEATVSLRGRLHGATDGRGRTQEERATLRELAVKVAAMLREAPRGSTVRCLWTATPPTVTVVGPGGPAERMDRTRTVLPAPDFTTELKARVCRRLTRPRPGTVAAHENALIALLAR